MKHIKRANSCFIFIVYIKFLDYRLNLTFGLMKHNFIESLGIRRNYSKIPDN